MPAPSLPCAWLDPNNFSIPVYLPRHPEKWLVDNYFQMRWENAVHFCAQQNDPMKDIRFPIGNATFSGLRSWFKKFAAQFEPRNAGEAALIHPPDIHLKFSLMRPYMKSPHDMFWLMLATYTKRHLEHYHNPPPMAGMLNRRGMTPSMPVMTEAELSGDVILYALRGPQGEFQSRARPAETTTTRSASDFRRNDSLLCVHSNVADDGMMIQFQSAGALDTSTQAGDRKNIVFEHRPVGFAIAWEGAPPPNQDCLVRWRVVGLIAGGHADHYGVKEGWEIKAIMGQELYGRNHVATLTAFQAAMMALPELLPPPPPTRQRRDRGCAHGRCDDGAGRAFCGASDGWRK